PIAETLTHCGEKLHGLSEGRTNRVMTEPLAPSRGMGRPLSSRLTPPALPIVITNGPFEIHSRISFAGIVSSLVRPSSVRTRIHVVSVVRAMSRYGKPSPGALGVTEALGAAPDDCFASWFTPAGCGTGLSAGAAAGAEAGTGDSAGASAAPGNGGSATRALGSSSPCRPDWSTRVTAKKATPRTRSSMKLTNRVPRARLSRGSPCGEGPGGVVGR